MYIVLNMHAPMEIKGDAVKNSSKRN